MSDVSQQYNDVTKELYQNQLKLTEAQTKGEAASKGMDETYQKLLSTLGMTDDEFQKTYGSVSAIAGVHLDPEIADEVMDLRDSYEEYSNQQLEAAENEKVYQQAVDDGIAKQGEAQQAIEDAQTAYENLEAAQSGATSSASEGAAELGQAISDVTVEAQKLVEAYNTAYDAAEKSIGGQYEIWDKASSVSATSVDALNKNLESQTTYWQDYNTNLDTLREKAGSIEGLSEMTANVVMTPADHYIKRELCAPYYARYMDDMGAIIEGKAAAWELVEEVDNYLQTNLGLNLNQKTAVIPIGNPVEFVGRKISPVKIELRRQTTLGMKKHLRYVQDAYAAGEIDLDYALSVITSYRGLFKDVTSDAFLEKMLDEFVLSRPALEA